VELNQKVKWWSQAQGCAKTKAGEIVQVVPAGGMPDRDRFQKLYTGAGVGSPRDHESYVVLVDVGKVPGRTFRAYWPRVSALKVAG